MLARVGRETHHCHAPADADRLAIMDVSSVAQYRRFLARIYGLEAAVELDVSGVLARDPNAADLRARIGRLHDDLMVLGMSSYDVASLPRCTTVAIHSPAEALGWLYVLERACLVAGLIRRHIATQLPDAIAIASGYLATPAPGPGHRLRMFGDHIADQVRRGVVDPGPIIAAARRAFAIQRNWYAPIVRLRTRSAKTAPLSPRPLRQAG